MDVQLVSNEGSQVKIEVTIELSHSMLTSEENIQNGMVQKEPFLGNTARQI
jgi:hypothetical protein